MVRTNQETDFSFPFGNEKQTVIHSNYFDKTDRLLSYIALSFFMGVLFLISLDGAQATSQNNGITSSLSQQGMIMGSSLFAINNLEDKTKNIERPLTEKSANPIIKISTQPKKETLLKTIPKKSRATKSKIVEIQKSTIVNLPEVVNSNFSKTVSPIKNKTFKLNTSPTKSATKPQLTRINAKPSTQDLYEKANVITLKKEVITKELVINKSITQDLLPTSYFEAKEKAAQEGKLLLISFGAKWCLPCRQMKQTTFKNDRVKDILENEYIGLNVDVDDFDGLNLQSYFNVKMLPTMLVFNTNGKFLAKYSKFISANQMVKVLESHSPETIEIKENKNISIPLASYVAAQKKPSVVFNQIHLKKSLKGNAITQFRAKAKNWRFTSIDMNIQNINEGTLKINIIEKNTGKRISNLDIPLTSRNTDTTTTNFQLDLPLQKRKKKGGEYVLEIFHVVQHSSKLIGETTLANDGIIF